MPKYIISLTVQVPVDATSPKEAERIALKEGMAMAKAPDAHVSAAQFVREVKTH